MGPTEILLILAAFAVGLLVGWLYASYRLRSNYQRTIISLEAARAAHQTSADELRRQVNGLDHELNQTRRRLEEEQKARIAAETTLQESVKNLEEQKAALENVRMRMEETFQSLSAAALQTTTEEFLKLATTKFETLKEQATGEFKQKEEAIRGIVQPLEQMVSSLQEELRNLEKSRERQHGELATQIELLASTSQELRQETGALVTSLRQPQIKGKWGELTLRRAVELAGMSPYCDFVEQPEPETEETRLRADMLVRLPGGTQIVVDAKVPLHAFLTAVSARTAQEYQRAMEEHARLVRTHVRQLGTRRYWQQFERTPEFVVLFLPGESFFSAALEQDRTLIEDSMEHRVILASPTTLLALLRAVAYGWRQQVAAESAARISSLARDLYERIVIFVEHLAEIRVGLERANSSYNKAIASLESRLLPSARRFEILGIGTAESLPQVEPVETTPRHFVLPSDEPETEPPG